jgi:hypothetical protein
MAASVALAEMPFLSMREVAEQISPSEFAKLCGEVDKQFGKRVTEVSNAEGTFPKTASRIIGVKFDILDILRNREKLNVILVAGNCGPVRITVK